MSIPYNAPPVEIAITPYNNANRPKLYMDPEYETVHEVGNTAPGANEDMHKLFVHNGGGPAQVSFHFVVGPTKAIQLIPLDEAAWHASDGYNGTGNRKSVAIETIQIGDFNKTLWHLAWLLNELEVNPGRFYANERRSDWKFSINRIKQHHDWAPDGKDCPEFIRDRGLWPTLMERVDAWHAAGQPEPAPEPEPVPEPEPDTKHELPAGISPELARRLFGRYIAPWDRTEYSFDITQAPSQVWVARGKKTGQWPSLNVVVRRGNGNEFWVWSNGDTYERKLSTQRGAA
jgi:N-acetylmuramoyl-L-alanine amidase